MNITDIICHIARITVDGTVNDQMVAKMKQLIYLDAKIEQYYMSFNLYVALYALREATANDLLELYLTP